MIQKNLFTKQKQKTQEKNLWLLRGKAGEER